MTAITYRERLAGHADFGAEDFNDGWIAGRAAGSRCAFALEVTVDDVDAFVADLVAFGLEYAAVVRDDHRHFVEAFRAGRIPGVSAT